MQSRRDVLKAVSPLALLGCFAALTVPMGGCQSAQRGGAMGVVNSRCPVMMDCPLPANPVTADYKGGKVGFCCAGCIDEWNQMTDAQRAERLAKVR